MKVEYIKCGLCGKVIEKKGTRIYCIPCRNKLDKKRIKERTQTPEFRKTAREKYLAKKGLQ